MQILRRAGYRQMPWKNGQGLTEEVLTFPEGSTVDAFDWRISIAHVGADGPFSLFPGIDRTIALLDGAGLILDLPDETEQLLSPGGKPFAFPGEWDISSRNVDGGTMDLNIMTRRGRATHRLTRQRLEAGAALIASTTTVLIVNAPATLDASGVAISLQRFEGLLISSGEMIAATGSGADCLVAELFAAA
jgi:environmental stress-induced protein Ves